MYCAYVFVAARDTVDWEAILFVEVDEVSDTWRRRQFLVLHNMSITLIAPIAGAGKQDRTAHAKYLMLFDKMFSY